MTKATVKEIKKRAQEAAVKETRRVEEEKIIREAAEVYVALGEVVKLISNGKFEDALRGLESIQNKLEKLYREEGVKYVPVRSLVYEFIGVDTLDEATKLVEDARKALEENDLIKARDILNILRNEIIIDTYVLPIGIFKEAVELASEFARLNDWVKALNSINMALESIKVTQTIIPRPLLEAYYLVEEASRIYEEKPDDAVEILAYARSRIELAKTLGYVKDEKSIKPILERIEKLEKDVEGKKAKKKTFEDIQKDIEEVKEKETRTTKEVKNE